MPDDKKPSDEKNQNVINLKPEGPKPFKKSKRGGRKKGSKNKPKTVMALVSSQGTIVELPRVGLTQHDIDKLDTGKLRDVMLKGVYSLEAALFQQADCEYERVVELRKHIKALEQEVLKPEVFSLLLPHQKLKLWQTLIDTQQISLGFLNKLHDNVASGLDAVNKIDQLKAKPLVDQHDHQGDVAVEQVKTLLMNAIKEKLKKDE